MKPLYSGLIVIFTAVFTLANHSNDYYMQDLKCNQVVL
jgi:hypothetical protein